MPEYDFPEHCGQWDNQVTLTGHYGYDYGGEFGKKSTLHNERRNRRFLPTDEYYLYEIFVSPYIVKFYINGVVKNYKL